ncbi:MAG: signal peptide peptidase SppA [Elusimicrobia bacterium]|nr:signal peptide peptidase SppA [Elusimicrobiota bacterium]
MEESGSRRKIVLLLILLYGLSVVAALGILYRGGLKTKESSALSVPVRLLSMRKAEGVGWISIRGPIYESESGRLWESGLQQWVRRIHSLAEKPEVKALVLDINSPGGSVASVQELYSQILKVRKEKKKPVVALLGDVAASGGYYIASACDKIVARPGTLTGSIGVIFSVSNVEGLFGKLGIRVNPIKSGKHKDIGSPTRPMLPEEKQILQGLIDDAYSQFLDAVTAGRALPLEKIKPLADGRIYTGRQAQAMGLVDILGGIEEAVKAAAELGGIKGEPKIIRGTDPLDQFRNLLEMETRWSHWRDLGNVLMSSGVLEYRWKGNW